MDEAVVFDFDGTLVDSYSRRREAHAAVASILAAYLRDAGFDADRDALLAAVVDAEREFSERREWDRDRWWAAVLAEHTDGALEDPDPDALAEATLSYWNTVTEVSTTYPHAEALLQSLDRQGVPVGYISDTDGLDGMKHQRIEASALGEYADVVVVAGEDTAAAKPDVAPFQQAADGLGVAPEDCVFVGDNPTTDVPGANRLGMTTVLVENDTDYIGESDVAPDYTVDREEFERLREILAGCVAGFDDQA